MNLGRDHRTGTCTYTCTCTLLVLCRAYLGRAWPRTAYMYIACMDIELHTEEYHSSKWAKFDSVNWMPCRNASLHFDSVLLFRQAISHANFNAFCLDRLSPADSAKGSAHVVLVHAFSKPRMFLARRLLHCTLRAAPVQCIWSGAATRLTYSCFGAFY